MAHATVVVVLENRSGSLTHSARHRPQYGGSGV